MSNADGYYERIKNGLCPACRAPYGVAPGERHRLPRIARGDGWEFVAPCGHSILGIRKGSPLAKLYGLDGEQTPR